MDRPLERCLEVDGAKGIGDEYFWRGTTRFDDRLMANIEDGKISMQVTTYVHAPGDKFDDEEWQNQSCYIYGPPNRNAWKNIYRIGRALARHGKTTVTVRGDDPFDVACDGTTLTFVEE